MTEDSSTLRRWMITGPEVSHLIVQYEAASQAKERGEHTNRHEQTIGVQRMFLEKVEKLSQIMTDMGNPFQEEIQDLLSLDMKDYC